MPKTQTTKTAAPRILAKVGADIFAAARNGAMAQKALADAFAAARKAKIDLAFVRRDYIAGWYAARNADLTDKSKAAAYAFADSAGSKASKVADGQIKRTEAQEVQHAAARKAWQRAIDAIGEAAVSNKGGAAGAVAANATKAKAKRNRENKHNTKASTPAAPGAVIVTGSAIPANRVPTPDECVDQVAHYNNAMAHFAKQHAKQLPGYLADAIAKATALVHGAIGTFRTGEPKPEAKPEAKPVKGKAKGKGKPVPELTAQVA